MRDKDFVICVIYAPKNILYVHSYNEDIVKFTKSMFLAKGYKNRDSCLHAIDDIDNLFDFPFDMKLIERCS